MVRALFPHAFRGRRLVNRDRFRAGGGQFERIGLPGLVVAPPDRRSFALISFKSPASRSLATALCAWARFGPAGRTRQ